MVMFSIIAEQIEISHYTIHTHTNKIHTIVYV